MALFYQNSLYAATEFYKLLKLEKKEMHILPQKKIRQYLAEADHRRLLAAFYLELTTGSRRGELLALLWTDLDVEARIISVTKQVNRIGGKLVVSLPKTQNSVRTLTIPQLAVRLFIKLGYSEQHIFSLCCYLSSNEPDCQEQLLTNKTSRRPCEFSCVVLITGAGKKLCWGS